MLARIRTLLVGAIAVLMLASIVSPDASGQLKTRGRYVLRPGDTIETEYRLTADLNQTVIVQPDGYVNLHIAGDVKVGGLTVEQAHDLIVKVASEHLNNPELNLVLKDFNRPSITVAGEVGKPGRFELREDTSALDAIMLAGGFTGNAQTGQVAIFRKVNDQIAEIRTLNLSKMKKTSDLEHDMQLQSGDVVFIPRDKIAKWVHYMSVANVGMYFNPADAFR